MLLPAIPSRRREEEIETRVKSLGLFHLNQKRTDADVEKMMQDARALHQRLDCVIPCKAVETGFVTNL